MRPTRWNVAGLTLGEVLYTAMVRKGYDLKRLKKASGVLETDIKKIMQDVECDDYAGKAERLVHAMDLERIIPCVPTLELLGEEVTDAPVRRLMTRWGLKRLADLAALVGLHHNWPYACLAGARPLPQRLLDVIEQLGLDPDYWSAEQDKYQNHVQNKLRRQVRLAETARGQLPPDHPLALFDTEKTEADHAA